MTRQQAYDRLPDNAEWSCSFGYPGQGGFIEHYRTPDGQRFVISNGSWDGPEVWSVQRD